jgi:hypothetical protein
MRSSVLSSPSTLWCFRSVQWRLAVEAPAGMPHSHCHPQVSVAVNTVRKACNHHDGRASLPGVTCTQQAHAAVQVLACSSSSCACQHLLYKQQCMWAPRPRWEGPCCPSLHHHPDPHCLLHHLHQYSRTASQQGWWAGSWSYRVASQGNHPVLQ